MKLTITVIFSIILLGISNLILSRQIEFLVNPRSTGGSLLAVSGPSNWFLLIFYLALPYIVSTVIYVLIAIKFNKEYVVFAFAISLTMAIFFFPKIVFYTNIEAPPETFRSHFTYRFGNIGYSAHAYAKYLTHANLNQIISFYERKQIFEGGELERLNENMTNPKDVLYNKPYEFYALKNGANLSIDAYPVDDTYVIFIDKSINNKYRLML